MHSVLIEPTYERPPEGLSRGRWPAPRWAIAALGAIVVIAALVYLFFRLRRALRGRG